MDALIFDFDGVVVDSEPIHFAGFKHVLAQAGLEMSEQKYYADYLGYDDHDCLAVASADQGQPFSEDQIAQLTAAKTAYVQDAFRQSIEALPGAAEIITQAAHAEIPLAICSGALREEIELAATTIGLREHFGVIVSAEDVDRGKPDPEGYLKALGQLRQAVSRELQPFRCVVVEDSPAGIQAAKQANMRVLALETSYAPAALTAADRVVANLAAVSLADLEALVGA